ncbi:Protein farnesyltransferase subunit beta domain-containing protein [Rozella allomycis CSF55]|uniref:Protein farnesyltransferase subunit beta n=1 Tax=Rozella allomycis (strain CSF55) TaxID=988480 RepID=A0A075B362_ROZAC|nr:Protein farnesyltransferase subunit beta domain-containing protein [Rozella allomycis CSF55]|eukprot:EPZ36789.1 Protein farnesyltransferase subunit beta domain-containing protein [Rozella allomycis CSF55]
MDFLHLSYNDDNFATKTSDTQSSCIERFQENNSFTLKRQDHIDFILENFVNLESYMISLDSSQTWLCYWMCHSLALLDAPIPHQEKYLLIICFKRLINTIRLLQSEQGGFAGAPGMIPHLASSYAAILAIATIGTPEAYSIVNTKKLYEFLASVKHKDGFFYMQQGGEVDVRGCYCAIVCAYLTGIMDDKLTENVAEYILKCQTYEGGFGGIPDAEAHGGYTFCAVAALKILGRVKDCNMDALIRFVSSKQMKLEGGFQGRCNKLVDGCYSFWQAAIFPIIESELPIPEFHAYNQEMLQRYLLCCCQLDLEDHGGMLDKPEKIIRLSKENPFTLRCMEMSVILGDESNELKTTHPVFNIVSTKVDSILDYFKVK